MTNPLPEATEKSQDEKIPGKWARVYMRAQTIITLTGMIFTPFYTIDAVRKGKLASPSKDSVLSAIVSFLEPRSSGKVGGSLHSAANTLKEKLPAMNTGPLAFKFDISSPLKRAATIAGGALVTAYLGMNSIARLRTVKDAATREKISLGELEPENALFKSNPSDRTLTKIEASVSTTIAMGSLGYVLHSVATKSPQAPKTGGIIFASVSAVVAGVMSVVKFRAANAAEKHAQDMEALKEAGNTMPETQTSARLPQPEMAGRSR